MTPTCQRDGRLQRLHGPRTPSYAHFRRKRAAAARPSNIRGMRPDVAAKTGKPLRSSVHDGAMNKTWSIHMMQGHRDPPAWAPAGGA